MALAHYRGPCLKHEGPRVNAVHRMADLGRSWVLQIPKQAPQRCLEKLQEEAHATPPDLRF